jgi:hypothetical protein
MTETITGGAYRGADGSWHDANGKPLLAHVIQQLEEQERQREGAQPQPEAEPEAPVLAAAHYVGAPEEEPVAKPKPRRKTKGGD